MIRFDLSVGQVIIVFLVSSVVGGYLQGFFRAAGEDTRKWWERKRRG